MTQLDPNPQKIISSNLKDINHRKARLTSPNHPQTTPQDIAQALSSPTKHIKNLKCTLHFMLFYDMSSMNKILRHLSIINVLLEFFWFSRTDCWLHLILTFTMANEEFITIILNVYFLLNFHSNGEIFTFFNSFWNGIRKQNGVSRGEGCWLVPATNLYALVFRELNFNRNRKFFLGFQSKYIYHTYVFWVWWYGVTCAEKGLFLSTFEMLIAQFQNVRVS